eukprot:2947811-Amphidinium_carterae.1
MISDARQGQISECGVTTSGVLQAYGNFWCLLELNVLATLLTSQSRKDNPHPRIVQLQQAIS